MVKALCQSLLIITVAVTAVAAPSTAHDLKMMNQARALYAKNKMSEAISIYSKIKPSSDFWLDSLEERAWAYTSQQNYEKALGDLKSITSDIWGNQVGPETHMLSAFVSLKICSYKDVVDKIKKFKTKMLPRVEQLQAIQEGFVADEEFNSYMQKATDGTLRMSALGSKAQHYPRYFFRDQALLKAFSQKNSYAVKSRMQALAASDLQEIEKNLKKMKVIEVEVMQRIYMADDIQKSKEKLAFQKYDRDNQVSFPITDDEVWVDEVGRYEVKAQGCPQKSVQTFANSDQKSSAGDL